MGEYLKMAGVFDFPVKPRHVHDENGYGFKLMLFHSVEAEFASNAINSHDDLVAEVKRLRRQLSCAFMAGWEEGVNGMECDEAEVASVEIAEQFAKK